MEYHKVGEMGIDEFSDDDEPEESWDAPCLWTIVLFLMLFLMLSAFLSLAGLESCYVIPMDFWKTVIPMELRASRPVPRRFWSWWTWSSPEMKWTEGSLSDLEGWAWRPVPRELRDVMGKLAIVGLVVLLFAIGFLEYVPRNQKYPFLAVIYRVISCNIWDWPWLSRLLGELLYRNMVSNGGLYNLLSSLYCSIASPADWENTPGLGAQQAEA